MIKYKTNQTKWTNEFQSSVKDISFYSLSFRKENQYREAFIRSNLLSVDWFRELLKNKKNKQINSKRITNNWISISNNNTYMLSIDRRNHWFFFPERNESESKPLFHIDRTFCMKQPQKKIYSWHTYTGPMKFIWFLYCKTEKHFLIGLWKQIF